MVLELERAERVAYLFDGIALAVREVIARVDVPDGAGARMAGVENTVDNGVTLPRAKGTPLHAADVGLPWKVRLLRDRGAAARRLGAQAEHVRRRSRVGAA